jgi:hypothetical protein
MWLFWTRLDFFRVIQNFLKQSKNPAKTSIHFCRVLNGDENFIFYKKSANRIEEIKSSFISELTNGVSSVPSRDPWRGKNRPESVFVNLLRSPGIDSQPGGPVRQPFMTYRPVRLAEFDSLESILGSLNVYKYGLWPNSLGLKMALWGIKTKASHKSWGWNGSASIFSGNSARLHRLAESIPWTRFLGSLKGCLCTPLTSSKALEGGVWNPLPGSLFLRQVKVVNA